MYDNDLTDDDAEALEMLIKAQEACDDAISRSQALEELMESAEAHANNSREVVLLRRDRDIIRSLPPVRKEMEAQEV